MIGRDPACRNHRYSRFTFHDRFGRSPASSLLSGRCDTDAGVRVPTAPYVHRKINMVGQPCFVYLRFCWSEIIYQFFFVFVFFTCRFLAFSALDSRQPYSNCHRRTPPKIVVAAPRIPVVHTSFITASDADNRLCHGAYQRVPHLYATDRWRGEHRIIFYKRQSTGFLAAPPPSYDGLAFVSWTSSPYNPPVPPVNNYAFFSYRLPQNSICATPFGRINFPYSLV